MESAADIQFRGGHVALDFVNTAEDRDGPGPGDEALSTADDLLVWGQRRGVLRAGARSGAGDDDELAAAVEARELLYQIFRARARGELALAADITRLGRLAALAYQVAELVQGSDGQLSWSWDETQLATVRHVAVTSAVELLGQDLTARFRQCPGDACGWFFLDTTKRGNRRWCSMSECGQFAKTTRRRVRATEPRA